MRRIVAHVEFYALCDIPTGTELTCNNGETAGLRSLNNGNLGEDDIRCFAASMRIKERVLENVQIPLQWAPGSLYQPILPGWQVSLFSINLGASTDAETEKATIQQVGSYGKQIGHLAEALEVVIKQLKLLDSKGLSQDDMDALQVFLGDAAAVRSVKVKKALV